MYVPSSFHSFKVDGQLEFSYEHFLKMVFQSHSYFLDYKQLLSILFGNKQIIHDGASPLKLIQIKVDFLKVIATIKCHT